MQRVVYLDGIEPFELPFAAPAVALACGRVDDHTGSLLAVERTGIARVRDIRRREYSSGRRVARQALRLLGMDNRPVTARSRIPVWPPGVVGSITHSRSVAMAMVGFEGDIAGIGLDLELQRRVTGQLADRVLLTRERDNLAEPDWRTMLFAAKEAAYKAVNPLIGEYLGFEDVEVTADEHGGFSAVTTRALKSTSALEMGRGYYQRVEGHWLCVFFVPGD